MFCKFCGAKIDDDSIFCAHCGKQLNSSYAGKKSPTTESSSSTRPVSHKISFYRESQSLIVGGILSSPRINILIDDKLHYSIGRGETLEIELPDGEHLVSFSKTLDEISYEFDLIEDISIVIKYSAMGFLKVLSDDVELKQVFC